MLSLDEFAEKANRDLPRQVSGTIHRLAAKAMHKTEEFAKDGRTIEQEQLERTEIPISVSVLSVISCSNFRPVQIETNRFAWVKTHPAGCATTYLAGGGGMCSVGPDDDSAWMYSRKSSWVAWNSGFSANPL
jgi:hypothetical protein